MHQQVGKLILIMLLLASAFTVVGQEDSPREAILASIPSLINFEEQAEGTFVGDVEGSYAFIAFVIRDGFAVVYLCDNVLVSAWLSGEIVDGTLEVQTEDGIHLIATILEDRVEGTVTLTMDNDGSDARLHTFTAVPVVPGQTGLARYMWEDGSGVSGWIVTEKGIRGKKNIPNFCEDMKRVFDLYVKTSGETASIEAMHLYWDAAYEVSVQMAAAGCPAP